MRLRNFIRIMLVVACWIPVGCVLFLPVESLEHGEVRFGYPIGEFTDHGAKDIPLPAKCAPLYGVGRFEEWADCMGVEKK